MTIRLLVIDDDPGILELLEGVLEDLGADVVTSDFPGNLTELVGQTHPDLVLLDLKDGSNQWAGLGLLGELRFYPQTETLPVLLMSGDDTWLTALATSLQERGVGVVSKPFDFEGLWRMIEQAVQPPSAGKLPKTSAQPVCCSGSQ